MLSHVLSLAFWREGHRQALDAWHHQHASQFPLAETALFVQQGFNSEPLQAPTAALLEDGPFEPRRELLQQTRPFAWRVKMSFAGFQRFDELPGLGTSTGKQQQHHQPWAGVIYWPYVALLRLAVLNYLVKNMAYLQEGSSGRPTLSWVWFPSTNTIKLALSSITLQGIAWERARGAITRGRRISGTKYRYGNRMFTFTFFTSTSQCWREIVRNEILP